MSHHRKNSVRDKVIGKWIYSDTERSGCTEGGPWQGVNAAARCGLLSFIGWVVSHASEWAAIPAILGRAEVSWMWAPLPPRRLGTVTSGRVRSRPDSGSGLLSAVSVLFDSHQSKLCPWATSCFQKARPAAFPPVTCTPRVLLSIGGRQLVADFGALAGRDEHTSFGSAILNWKLKVWCLFSQRVEMDLLYIYH